MGEDAVTAAERRRKIRVMWMEAIQAEGVADPDATRYKMMAVEWLDSLPPEEPGFRSVEQMRVFIRECKEKDPYKNYPGIAPPMRGIDIGAPLVDNTITQPSPQNIGQILQGADFPSPSANPNAFMDRINKLEREAQYAEAQRLRQQQWEYEQELIRNQQRVYGTGPPFYMNERRAQEYQWLASPVDKPEAENRQLTEKMLLDAYNQINKIDRYAPNPSQENARKAGKTKKAPRKADDPIEPSVASKVARQMVSSKGRKFEK